MGGWSRSQRTRAGIGGAPSTTGSERRPGEVFFCYWFLASAPNHARCFFTEPSGHGPPKDPAGVPKGSGQRPHRPALTRARLRAIAGTAGLVRRHFRRPVALAPSSNRPRTVLESSLNRPRRFRPAQVVGPVSLVTIAIIVMIARTTSRVGPRPALYTFYAHSGKRGRALAPLRTGKKRGPALLSKNWAITWQRPTLAGPNVLLPLAAEGLTAVFGMGTGGTPRLWSPRSESPFGESVKI